jgi:hypothetical protein
MFLMSNYFCHPERSEGFNGADSSKVGMTILDLNVSE